MRNVDALQEYAKFSAAKAWMAGSATDARVVDLTDTASEGVTDLGVMGQFFEPTWGEQNISLTVSTDVVFAAGWTRDEPSPSDFEELDSLRTPEGQIRGEIRRIRAGLRLGYSKRLARRLEALLEAMEESGEAWSDASPDSLRMMLLFLQSVPDLRYPTITITPAATFRAQWTVKPDAHFAAEFLPNGQVRFVVFSPDPSHPGRIQRASGIASWDNLMRVVEPHNVRRWAVDAAYRYWI